MNDVIINVQNLTMGYGNNILLENASYEINRGDIFIIMGGSGCGKSSMLRILTGLINPLAGNVFIDGVDITSATEDEFQKIRMSSGILYQSGALFSSMTLAENISLPLQQYSNYSEKEIEELASFKLTLR